MTGKTCIVTGANSGIGFATAEQLAARGANVVMVCRDILRGESALKAIQEKTGNSELELQVADLAQFADIRKLADRIRAKHPHIDVLINNAAIVPKHLEVTRDGFEKQFAVNHLAPFLLTNLLLDTLKASAPARVITVSSTLHNGAKMNWDDLNFENGYSVLKVYGHSKLANILFTKELARRLEGSGVTANCLHPGGVRTNIMRDAPLILRVPMKLASFLMLSPKQGAKTSVFLACDPSVANTTGEYFEKCKPVRSSAESCDPAAAERLWNLSAEMTGLAA